MTYKLKHCIPILRIFDEEKANDFYVDFLGFNLDWSHRYEENFPIYFQISKNNCIIHLSEHHGDCCPGAAIRIPIDNVEAFNRELRNKRYKYANPETHKTPHRSHDMTINDPFGNKIIFTERLK